MGFPQPERESSASWCCKRIVWHILAFVDAHSGEVIQLTDFVAEASDLRLYGRP
ncbi:hypothetical protein BD311DRAFT_808500 [Dichomitus squalens]|uniref:Fungal-type protein kinase domain-containing protein n=1 Tax=Dichomitus squalens TaxID=114155 RepID=A0A4Q9MHT4_9APHY|nr:hypothetical protein BD311DRAFT_808500 [Dichomitus squalens]